MANKTRDDIINQLTYDINKDVGNTNEDDIQAISAGFNKSLLDALHAFNSSTFDDDGFVKKMRGLDLGNKDDSDTIRNVLNNVRSDYISADVLNQSELLLRRDIFNICVQMPEMHDVINTVRDSIIECNVSSGEVSRNIVFLNHEDDDFCESYVRDIEEKHDLLLAIKNFIVPKGLMHGEMYIEVTPYSKLFAEIEALRDNQKSKSSNLGIMGFKESIPPDVLHSFKESSSLYSEENLQTLMEAAGPMTKIDSASDKKIDGDKKEKKLLENVEDSNRENISKLLKSIDVYNGSSVMMSEYGPEMFQSMVLNEYKESHTNAPKDGSHFMEYYIGRNATSLGVFGSVDQDAIDFSSYNEIKGCYIKYLDGLRMVPVRVDRRVIGYYYVSTTMDLQTNAANPNGIIDLSFQNYTRDRNMVSTLAQMIIKSFDKKMLERNIQLKNEIAEIIMAHKFAEGKLSFIYIPENEVVRIVLNEDENGKGHSILEPSLFPARMYLMLTMYNMLYTLNNNTTRVHYLKSSGLNRDYASKIQRTIRKFQQRRITIDDIYSYSGVLNKVGGMGEMVLPAGRNDFKALETDTIPAVDNPINTEFLEQQRRQAISGTGAPHLLIINALDEVDFAKTLEMANARFQSTVASYKIDFNKGITRLYQKILKYSTDLDDDVINSFRFNFNEAKQQELSITTDMITNYNNLVEMAESMYYTKAQLEDENGNPTPRRRKLRKELAKKYLSQLEIDELDEIIKRVEIDATDDILQDKVNKARINPNDVNSFA